MQVDITQADIDSASRSSRKCPIAQALMRMGYKNVGVGYNTASFYEGNVSHLYNLPYEANMFVRRYDGRMKVEPMSFTLESQ